MHLKPINTERFCSNTALRIIGLATAGRADCVNAGAALKASGNKLGENNVRMSNACATLTRRGYLERCRTLDGRAKPNEYRLTERGAQAYRDGKRVASGPQGPHSKQRSPQLDTVRQRLWRAICVHEAFCIADLVASVTGATTSNATKYLQGLTAAGYTVRHHRNAPSTAKTGNGFGRWVLINNTGPLAPVPRPSKQQLYDPNINQTVNYINGQHNNECAQ